MSKATSVGEIVCVGPKLRPPLAELASAISLFWTSCQVPKSYWGGIPVIGPADTALLEKLRQAAEEITHKAASRLGDAGPASVTVRAVSGFVVKELVDASQDADLVVLGARGGSGFARLLMGSVSSEVVQHSACPVVIVPHAR